MSAHPTKFKKPTEPPTPAQDARWVLMGAGARLSSVHLTRASLPFIPKGPGCPLIPFFIMVPSQAIADEYAELLEFFNALADIPRAEVVGNLVKALGRSKTCRRVLLAERSVYAVVKGKRGHQGYYIKWADVHPWINNASIFKKHDTLFEAISWVVDKGTTAALPEPPTAEPPEPVDDDSDAEQIAQLARSLSLDMNEIRSASPTSLAQSDQRGTPRAPSSLMPADSLPHNASNAQPAPTRLPTATTNDSLGASRNNLQETSISEMPRRPRMVLAPPHSTSSQQVVTTTLWLYPPLTAEDLRMVSKRQVDRGALVSRDQVVCYTRTMAGQIEGEIVSACNHVPIDDMDVPSLGDVVDSFLDAWGYESELIRYLLANYSTSTSAEEFSHRVKDHVTMKEALWYWRFIRVGPDVQMRVRDIPSLPQRD